MTQGITINRGASSPGRFRLFFVQSTADLTLDSLTLSGGYAGVCWRQRSGSGGGGAAGMGGAIFNQGSLSILNSTLTGDASRAATAGVERGLRAQVMAVVVWVGLGKTLLIKVQVTEATGADPMAALAVVIIPMASNGYPGQSGGGGGGGGRNEFVVSFAGLGGAGGFGGGGGGGGSDRKTAIEDDYLGSVGGDGGFGGGGGGTGLHKTKARFINRRSGSAFGGGASTYQAGGGGAGMGGAIFNYGGDVTISNSTIASNTSIGGEGGRNYNRTDYTADNLQLRGVFSKG